MGLKEFFNKFIGSDNKAVNPILKPKAAIAYGGYEAAANFSRDRSYLWTFDSYGYSDENSTARTQVARYARYLVDNFSYLGRILSVSETYAVGSGIVANAATGNDAFDAANTSLFDKWADNKYSSNNARLTFYEMQKLIVKELLTVGEIFIVLVKSPSGYPQLMLVRSEDVKASDKPNDDSINGLYVDAFGKVTAYNIYTDPANDVFQKVEAENVIHLMLHTKVGQLRGISPFVASQLSIRDYKDLINAEKKAVKIHSALTAVVTRTTGNAASDAVFGNIAQGTGYDVSTEPTPGTSNIGLERAFAGNVVYAEPGEKVELLAGSRSTEGFRAFLEVLLREVCGNISLPYEFIINADKLNGTAMRFVIADAAAFFNNLQNILIDGLLNRVYGWVTSSFINNGQIEMPSKAFVPWAVSWTKPISITVDQTRVSNTEISLLQNGLLTYESYYSARGKDWKQELTQRAKEEQFLDALSKQTGVDINRLRTLTQGAALIEQLDDEKKAA